MPTIQEKANCIATLAGEAAKFEALTLQRDARARALDDVMGSGLGEQERAELHRLMDFKVKKKGRFGGTVKSMDKDGQRQSVETEDVKDYKSLTDEDWKNINKAMQKVLQLKDDLLAKKGPDGQPLFTEADLADELFTPLVREGLMPETLVIDEHSETAKLLKATFESYKEMLADLKKKKEEKAAKQDSDSAGAGTKVDKAKAKVGQMKDKVARYKDKTVGSVIARIGLGETEQDRKRVFKIGFQAVKTAKKGQKAFGTLMALPGELQTALQNPNQWSAGYEYLQGDTEQVEQLALDQELAEQAAQNPERVVFFANLNDALVQAFGPEAAPEILESLGTELDDMINSVVQPVQSAMASDTAVAIQTIVKDVQKLLLKVGKQGGKLGKNIYDLTQLEKVIQDTERKTQLQAAAIAALEAIDDAVTAVLAAASPLAAATLGGTFSDAIDVDDLVSQGLEEKTRPDKVVKAVAGGLEKVLAEAATAPETASAFRAAGKSLASAYTSGVPVNTLAEALQGPSEKAFASLVPPAAAAAKTAFTAKEFITAIQSPSATQQLQAKGTDQNAVLEDQLLKAKEEIANFERELVLVDEGGMEMAKQRSIANLITQLEHDRKVLEIAASAGNLIRGLGRAGTSLGVDIANIGSEGITDMVAQVGAQTVATEIGGQVTAGLNAIRLVIQISVNIIKAAERWTLWYKFKGDVGKALKAKSALLPAIENFFNNKKEQIAFHTIEDAMLAIQLAGSVASTVPHPIAMAVGKGLTAVGIAGQQSNKLAQMTYDEVQLRRAWKNTREALNNPKNRRAGLQALHDNATLAAHSVAWAAMQGDAIAEQILRSCGVTAQSLADSDTDAKAVISYLETLLYEDRKLKDHEKVNSKWRPAKVELTVASWFATKHRGQTKATPKLNTDDTPDIDAGLKTVQAQKPTEKLRETLLVEKPETFQAYLEQSIALVKAFEKYTPKTEDQSDHDEMLDVVKDFQQLAEDRVYELQQLQQERTQTGWQSGTIPGR